MPAVSLRFRRDTRHGAVVIGDLGALNVSEAELRISEERYCRTKVSEMPETNREPEPHHLEPKWVRMFYYPPTILGVWESPPAGGVLMCKLLGRARFGGAPAHILGGSGGGNGRGARVKKMHPGRFAGGGEGQGSPWSKII